jgi:hypothetical protein
MVQALSQLLKLAESFLLRDILFSLDPRIRYFGYMDNLRGMVVSELRNKEESHPGETQLVKDLTFFKGAMATWSIYFGQVKYSVVSHDRFKIAMIPVDGGLVIITTEASLPLDRIELFAETVREQILLGKL